MISLDLQYRQEVLKDYPVGYWPLGSVTNSLPTYSQDYRPSNSITNGLKFSGNIGTGLFPGSFTEVFDGSTSYINIGTNGQYNYGNSVTMEAWTYCTDTGTTNINTVFGNGYGGYMMRLYQGNFQFIQSYVTLINAALVNYQNKWCHLVVADDGGNNYKMYFNGAIVASGNTGLFFNSTGWPLCIGVDEANDLVSHVGFFLGKIAHVALYNYALPQNRVIKHYKAGLGEVKSYNANRQASTSLSPQITFLQNGIGF